MLALGTASKLLLAADHFQRLVDDGESCPAVEWAESHRHVGGIEYHDLAGCRRTNNNAIIQAARALRNNAKATSPTVPVYFAPRYGPAAFRIVERFLPRRTDRISTGSCAIIALSLADSQLTNLVRSFQEQLARRNLNPKVEWVLTLTEEEQLRCLLKDLAVDLKADPESPWDPDRAIDGDHAARICHGVVEFAKLRGIRPITQDLTIEFARSSVHNRLAFGRNSARYQILTAHSAKNQEFHHVFVFWSFKGEKWSPALRRRLLYNAITRAKFDCTVLVLGDRKRIDTDPALSLLGSAMPAIDPRWGKKK